MVLALLAVQSVGIDSKHEALAHRIPFRRWGRPLTGIQEAAMQSGGSLNRTTVLAADDHAAVLERVVAELEPEFSVVGLVANGRDLLIEADKLHPDVVILDISMPELGGFDAAAQLHKTDSNTKIVFLTVHDRPEFVRAAFNAGALGYVIKNSLATDLTISVREVLAGRNFISPSLHMGSDKFRKEQPG